MVHGLHVDVALSSLSELLRVFSIPEPAMYGVTLRSLVDLDIHPRLTAQYCVYTHYRYSVDLRHAELKLDPRARQDAVGGEDGDGVALVHALCEEVAKVLQR